MESGFTWSSWPPELERQRRGWGRGPGALAAVGKCPVVLNLRSPASLLLVEGAGFWGLLAATWKAVRGTSGWGE